VLQFPIERVAVILGLLHVGSSFGQNGILRVATGLTEKAAL
jgi:hypothetical protein